PYPDIRIADLMAHASGIQREPVGRIWETLDFPSREELAKVARQGERLYPPGRYFHYSNMAFALLGELVARVGGGSWEQVVRKRILEPLGMRRTSLTPSAPMAEGYLVAPYSDEVVPEPPIDCGAIAPAGQLWSSATDLCRWSGALVGASPGVLSPELLDQMRAPRTISDLAHWRTGFGLGLMLLRDGDAIYQGHLGAMPGFLAAVLCHQASGMGVVLLTNCGAGIDLGGLAVELLGELRLAVPASTWSPGAAAPPAVAQLLGHWWSEGEEWTFRWKDQELQASPTRATPGELVTRFAHSGEDAFVAIDGRERGERMLVVRSPGGAVAKLYFATYPFTREWRSFGQGEQEA
ncbi:MAG: serine hydrolase domain-containing protein, partial [Candidatus Dormibacteria bacterium]